MSLASIGNPAWNTIRGVRFGMRYGPTLVAVFVTHSALEEIDVVSPDRGRASRVLQEASGCA